MLTGDGAPTPAYRLHLPNGGPLVASSRTLTWFVSVAALGVLGLLMSLTGAAQPFQSVAQRLSEPAESGIRRFASPVTELVSGFGSAGRLRDENRDLLTENERLRAEIAALREEDSRSQDLAELLKLGTRFGADQLTFAAVIARDPSPLRDVVQINRGRSDGIEEGMPVLGKGGALIGTIEQAHAGVAWVRLVTDPKSAANVLVQESRAPAVATGSADHALRLEYLAQSADTKAGDSVVTSGLGGSFPPGLLVGRVAKVEGGPLDVFKRVQVEPAARLASIESVAVLVGFRPLPIENVGR